MKKLDKDKKFILAVGIAALAIAVILVWIIITSADKKGNMVEVTKGSSSEVNSGDGSSAVKQEELLPGVIIYVETTGTLHDDGFEYEIIEDAKTPQMKIVSYYDI